MHMQCKSNKAYEEKDNAPLCKRTQSYPKTVLQECHSTSKGYLRFTQENATLLKTTFRNAPTLKFQHLRTWSITPHYHTTDRNLQLFLSKIVFVVI